MTINYMIRTYKQTIQIAFQVRLFRLSNLKAKENLA